MIHDLLIKFKKPSVYAGGFLFLILLLFFSCATPPAPTVQTESEVQASLVPERISWLKIKNTDWAEYFFYENKNYPLRYHCVKINLASKNLSIVTYPQSKNDFSYKNGNRTDFFTGMTGESFSKKFNSIVSVNTSPFKGRTNMSKLTSLTSTRKILGIHVSNKELLSNPVEKYSALIFKKNAEGFDGEILINQTNEDFSQYDFAFGGFFTILKDSKKLPFTRQTNDSRTAIGLSKNGKILFILVVEGEKQKKSIGLSFQECADIMLELGADSAMQMDGGSSSMLCINQKNMLQYKQIVKNAVILGFANK